MTAVPTTSSVLTQPMVNPAGMGRVCLDLDARTLQKGRQDGLEICPGIIGASSMAARVRPNPNSA
jgi:hypothetical protein